MSTSEKLSRLRAAGLSQAEIARKTGISQPTISRIERGLHVDPKESAVLAIGALFNKTIKGTKAA